MPAAPIQDGHRSQVTSATMFPSVSTLSARLAGHVTLALLALALPQVGPNRFWLAGLIVGVGSPLALLMHWRLSPMTRNAAEPLFDLILIVVLIHLVPEQWTAALCLGLLVSLAPSVGLHPASHWIYMGLGTLLVGGLAFAALLHEVSGWGIPLAVVAATYPSVLLYTRTQMQALSRLRERAEKVQGMTELAGSVAHDFNNLLTSISGHAELALARLPETHTARKDLGLVLKGAERGSLICRQLLSFAGSSPGKAVPVDVGAEIRAITALLRSVVPDSVQLCTQVPETPLYIHARVSQLDQVLMNVLLNASDAMTGREGRIQVVLRGQQSNGQPQVQVLVRDTGPGIPNNLLGRIMEPYYSTKDDGHGIGMATLQRIMQDSDGTVSIDSSRFGTEVILEWPATAAPAAAHHEPTPHATAPAAAPVQRRRILIVDDNDDVREVAHRMLEQIGFSVSEADSARAALQQFAVQHRHTDAVLLDLQMPDKDGWQCLHELREISDDTLVVICSGFDPSDGTPEFAQQDPALKFLKKPYRGEDLAAVLA